MSTQFGGDDVGAVVVDLGSHTVKAGYAGEDHPKAVFPSYIASNPNAAAEPKEGPGSRAKNYHIGSGALSYRRDDTEFRVPHEAGVIADWDLAEALYDHTFANELQVNPSEHPLLLTEPSYVSSKARARLAEVMFETFQVPALFLQKNAVLSCFASSKASGVVLDVGASMTTATPVHEGYVISGGVQVSPLAGNALADFAAANVAAASDGTEVVPGYEIKKKEVSGSMEIKRTPYPKTHPTYKLWRIREIMTDFQASVCHVSDELFDEASAGIIPAQPYELPDGRQIDAGASRFRIPEALFQPSLVNAAFPQGALAELTNSPYWRNPSPPAVGSMVLDAVEGSDPDIRNELFKTVIVTGGASLYPHFPERLQADIQGAAPENYKLKLKIIAANSSSERKYAAWIGGSILASLGSLQQLWISSREFAESGASIVDKRCP